MLAFDFVYYYYKSSDLGNIYKPCWINVSGLRPANKKFSSRKEDLIGISFRKSIILLDNKLEVMLINVSQW